jgi:hypothetical protein
MEMLVAATRGMEPARMRRVDYASQDVVTTVAKVRAAQGLKDRNRR